MRRLLSTRYSAGAFNFAMLILRLGVGILMMYHGYQKLTSFNETSKHMPNLFGMGTSVTTGMVVFAEFFCSVLLIIGLLTRIATIPLIILSCYILFKISGADFFDKGETISLYLTGFLVLLFAGPGRISIDGMASK